MQSAGVSLAHTKLGDDLNRVGQNRKALDHLRIAVEIDKRMSDADPNDLLATQAVYHLPPDGPRVPEPNRATTRRTGRSERHA